LLNGQIKKMIGSFFTSNPDAVKAAQSGAVQYELLPQGTLAEAIRAGGARHWWFLYTCFCRDGDRERERNKSD
jgi:acyl CoA:acetate/3-ketoacid CoA transferase alpha subunit